MPQAATLPHMSPSTLRELPCLKKSLCLTGGILPQDLKGASKSFFSPLQCSNQIPIMQLAR